MGFSDRSARLDPAEAGEAGRVTACRLTADFELVEHLPAGRRTPLGVDEPREGQDDLAPAGSEILAENRCGVGARSQAAILLDHRTRQTCRSKFTPTAERQR